MESEAGLQGLNTWIEISAPAYADNLRFFQRLLGPGVELSAVIKANAYGHGFLEIATLAAASGARSFCVHSLEEAEALRDAGFGQDVLILGPVALDQAERVVAGGFRVVVYHRQGLAALAAAAKQRGRPARLHLKLETGTYRQGVEGEELGELLQDIAQTPGLHLEGVYTHFADIEDTTDHRYAQRQISLFRSLADEVEAAGLARPLRHAACSAAALLFAETHFDLVRLGLSQYGLWPSKETYLSFQLLHGTEKARRALSPVLTWKTRISQIKTVPADARVGYGGTFQTTRESRLAVLPVGYSDGYDRRLSNQAWVLIRGRRAPVRGRVCMNLTLVEVTDIPDAALEDEVVLLGRQAGREISADQLAAWMGTINYEVVARLATHIPRRVVGTVQDSLVEIQASTGPA